MEKRELILDAALKLASTEGLGALSVRSVAAAAGVGATTLRHYFPSQALLHQAVVSRSVSRSLNDLHIRDTTRPPVPRLYECLLQFLPEPQEQDLALNGWFELQTLALGSSANEGVREMLRTGHGESCDTVRRWLRVLTEEGHTPTDDVDALSRRFVALVNGLHLELLLEPGSADLRSAKETLHWFARQAITARSG